MAGLFFLFAFVLIRAASFHDVDTVLGYCFAGFKLNWMFELGGIGLIVYSAIVLIQRKKNIKIIRRVKRREEVS